MMDLENVLEFVAEVFVVIGVGVIFVGGGHALFSVAMERPGSEAYFQLARRRFGRPLILGLEIIVAADIIETITIDPSIESATTLGVLVLIRIILSFSLDVEIDGMFPWRRAGAEHSANGSRA